MNVALGTLGRLALKPRLADFGADEHLAADRRVSSGSFWDVVDVGSTSYFDRCRHLLDWRLGRQRLNPLLYSKDGLVCSYSSAAPSPKQRYSHLIILITLETPYDR